MEMTMENTVGRNRIHPKKFALLLSCASIIMMFAGLTSAYMVRHAAGNWLEFQLPILFGINTGIILLSSLALHGAYRSFMLGKEKPYKGLLLAAFGLGLAFLVMQYLGWLKLQEIGVELNTNPSGSFVYAISGIHAAHVLGGVAALVVAVMHAFTLPFKKTAARKLRFELTLIYWHFVDLLWVYLYVFFVTQH
ncbi:MAG: cytochrome c oxidase subunit 3 [Haliscomenobacter sp.]|nr:cytochrome c oxidase subunit 3 [Haliscomenobacter sp.]